MLNKSQVFALCFTQQQVVALTDALAQLPYKTAEPLLRHIAAEIQKQFDNCVPDVPSGQTTEPDRFAGS